MIVNTRIMGAWQNWIIVPAMALLFFFLLAILANIFVKKDK
jgi:asparagine N-glycosylation enzyme membrane subunit Stt3